MYIDLVKSHNHSNYNHITCCGHLLEAVSINWGILFVGVFMMIAIALGVYIRPLMPYPEVACADHRGIVFPKTVALLW